MESPIKGRTVVDIGVTIDKHRDIIPGLLAAHALSGCDTAACSYVIGKMGALKALTGGKSLSLLRADGVDMIEVILEATQFMLTYYSQPKCTDLSLANTPHQPQNLTL